MAGIAVISFDRIFAIGREVIAVVATKTAGPVLVPDMVGIILLARLHFRKEVVLVDLLCTLAPTPSSAQKAG
jgi:hypothetical protein